MAKYFGTNGVRGRFDELTPELALKLSKAIGAYFKHGRIVLARDARLTGECLKSAIVSGLLSVGCRVIDLDLAPAPTAEFMVKELKADGCIIITASHNPPEWNAIKVVDGNGVAVSRERGGEIEKLMEKVKQAEWNNVGTMRRNDSAIVLHIEKIMSLVDRKKITAKRPKLVLDCGNGTAALLAPLLFRQLGADVLTINSHIDGTFPGRPSEPTEKNVRGLVSFVKSSGSDAGIAWDGDGDRVIFVDEKGTYIIGDKVMALSTFWKLSGKKGDVVTTVATSRVVEDIAGKSGAKVKYTKIGAPYLSAEMAKGGYAIGGEEVGGVIWPEISLAKDGFLTAAKMVEKLTEKKLSDWLKELPGYHNAKISVKADEKLKKEAVERVLGHAKKEGLDYTDVDGVRVNLEGGWVIVRPSGTENRVRIFSEAKTEKEAKSNLEEYKKIALG